MSNAKIAHKTPSIDMTPMVDLAFLLVTFFMLISQFRAPEPVVVDIPSSVSEIKVPEKDLITITLDRDNKVYFSNDGQLQRREVLLKMGEKYKIEFSDVQLKQFSNLTSFGMPVQSLAQWISLTDDQREDFKQPGIPIDSLNNQLYDWILNARLQNPKYRFVLKGDREAEYATLRKVIKILESCKVHKFNFVTNLEQPEQ